ncbi:MAG: ABC transporter permease [Acidimicrobiia bacterium]
MLAAADPWIRWSWVFDHTDRIVADLREHVIVTMLTVVIGLALSLPVSIAITRWRWLEAPAVGIAGVLYTIPSLAAFAFLIPYFGFTRVTALIPLVTYTFFIFVRNIVAGLDAVPIAAKDAADGMGYTAFQRTVRVELPLAMPSIIAALRLATVTTVGLVTVTALFGRPNLGELIYDGQQRSFRTTLVVGSVLALLLAVVADLLLVLVQRWLTPWNRKAGH